MIVSPIQQSKFCYYPKCSAKKNQQNVSFKAAGITVAAAYKALVYLNIFNRTQKSFKNSKKILEVKRNIMTLLENLDVDKKARAELLTCLRFIPKDIDTTGRYGLYTLFHEDTMSMADIKKKALNEIMPTMDDKFGPDVNAKREFLLSLFNNGEYIDDDFISAFKGLSEEYYGSFKEEFADMLLFRSDKYRPSREPEQYIYNLKLLRTLQNGKHKEYLTKNAESIKQAYNTTVGLALKKITETPNLAHRYYSYNGPSKAKISIISGEDLWDTYCDRALKDAILVADGDTYRLSKILNIDERLADDIMKDLYAIDDAEKTSDMTEKMEIYTKRIKEKFALEFPHEKDEYDGSFKYEALDTKCANIENFISKTENPDELKRIFGSDMDALRSECFRIYNKCYIDDGYDPYPYYNDL